MHTILPKGKVPPAHFWTKLAKGEVPEQLRLRKEHLGFVAPILRRLISVFDTRGLEYCCSLVPVDIGIDEELLGPIAIIIDHSDGHWLSIDLKPGARLPPPSLACWGEEQAKDLVRSSSHFRLHDRYRFWTLKEESESVCGCAMV